jgi:hypothetical protein
MNCGYSRGFSVLEVLNSVDRVTNMTIERRLEPRRAGDPDALVADNAQHTGDAAVAPATRRPRHHRRGRAGMGAQAEARAPPLADRLAVEDQAPAKLRTFQPHGPLIRFDSHR